MASRACIVCVTQTVSLFLAPPAGAQTFPATITVPRARAIVDHKAEFGDTTLVGRQVFVKLSYLWHF